MSAPTRELENTQRIVELAAARQARFVDSARQLLAILAEVPEVANGDAATCNGNIGGQRIAAELMEISVASMRKAIWSAVPFDFRHSSPR